ncbi:MAG: hypothetical protein R3C01_13035 [Planctomycetaceae bacterium]
MSCGTIAGSYVLGTYFVAFFSALFGGAAHWSLVIAPVTFPIMTLIGFLLVDNSEVPVQQSFLIQVLLVWGVAIVGCWGLLRSWPCILNTRWPPILFVADVVLIYFVFR